MRFAGRGAAHLGRDARGGRGGRGGGGRSNGHGGGGDNGRGGGGDGRGDGRSNGCGDGAGGLDFVARGEERGTQLRGGVGAGGKGGDELAVARGGELRAGGQAGGRPSGGSSNTPAREFASHGPARWQASGAYHAEDAHAARVAADGGVGHVGLDVGEQLVQTGAVRDLELARQDGRVGEAARRAGEHLGAPHKYRVRPDRGGSGAASIGCL